MENGICTIAADIQKILSRRKRNPLAGLNRQQCEYLIYECNFTPDELDVFNLRVREWSQVHIAMELNMSDRTVRRRQDSLMEKIYSVI